MLEPFIINRNLYYFIDLWSKYWVIKVTIYLCINKYFQIQKVIMEPKTIAKNLPLGF